MDWKFAMLFVLLLVMPAFAVGHNDSGPNGLGPQGGMQDGQQNGPKEGPQGGHPAKEVRAERMGGAMDNAICKAGFTIGVLESMMDKVEGVDYLQDDVDTLNDDVDALQGYVDSEDDEGFWAYVKDTYSKHMKDAQQNVQKARREANISNETREALRDDYKSMKGDYQSCNLESSKRFGQAKLDAYETILSNAEEKIGRLSEKGIDTAGLTQLVEDARSEIVEPLSEALEGSENHTEVKDALKSYCMFNGCPDGTNFHFAARFEVEKLASILEALSGNATEAGLGDDVQSAEDDLESAESELDDLGSEDYSEGQQESVWEHVRSAADKTKDILSKLRSE